MNMSEMKLSEMKLSEMKLYKDINFIKDEIVDEYNIENDNGIEDKDQRESENEDESENESKNESESEDESESENDSENDSENESENEDKSEYEDESEYENEGKEKKEKLTLKDVMLSLLDTCPNTTNANVKYYYQYEYDGNNLSKYEKLMDKESICIAAKNPDDAEILNICLRTLIDKYSGLITAIMEGSMKEQEEETWTRTYIETNKTRLTTLMVEKLLENKMMQMYTGFESSKPKKSGSKIYDKNAIQKLVEDKKTMKYQF